MPHYLPIVIKCDNRSVIGLIANLYTLKYNRTLYAWKNISAKLKLKYCSSDVDFLTKNACKVKHMHVKVCKF
jgi:hypothetical protein